jgi:hypothetical protein
VAAVAGLAGPTKTRWDGIERGVREAQSQIGLVNGTAKDAAPKADESSVQRMD